MTDTDTANWNMYVTGLIGFVGACLWVVWGLEVHCGTACRKCRPDSKRKH